MLTSNCIFQVLLVILVEKVLVERVVPQVRMGHGAHQALLGSLAALDLRALQEPVGS